MQLLPQSFVPRVADSEVKTQTARHDWCRADALVVPSSCRLLNRQSDLTVL